MANSSSESAADHRNKHLSINPPHQIFKDIHGSDNAIPLSPQWLLSKPGENKTGMGTLEAQGLQSPYGNQSDVLRPTRNVEETPDNLKKKDVFRPSLLDAESGRRDIWRDEERDTLSTIRKDRWRNDDKEFGDNKKVDRWDNVGPKFGEPRRDPNDRWTDSGNKDAAPEQRRESKWNSRWGPDHKEAENLRNRWDEPGKDGEIVREKAPSLVSGDGDHYRPWRPSQGRGRGEALHSQSTPNKKVSAFSHSRGRGDNTAIFSAGRGRLSSGGSLFTSASNQSHPLGSTFDKGERGPGEPAYLRYSRMKLLDVYRMAEKVCYEKFPDGFIEVPSLTCDQPTDPLALRAPSSDEVNVLDAIEKGKIVSSGAPQMTKDGPSGRNPVEHSQPRRIRPVGSREDTTFATEESKDESGETRNYPDDKFRPDASQEDYAPFRKGNDMLLQQPKGETRWQISEDPVLRRPPSLVFDREREVRKLLPSSPEELSLFYKDPQGLIQGPFSGSDIIGWFEAGYFGIDLLVRLASAPNDSPFSLLGDVMPHLRAKSGPPPGFTGAKQNEFVDATGTSALPGAVKVHPGMGEADMLQNDMRYRNVAGTAAENRFIESLMSGGLNNSAQGVQGYGGNSFGGLSLPVTDGGVDMYLLAKKLELERQRSIPSSYWPGRESANLMQGSENVLENAQQPGRSPSSDLLSILQGVTDRPSPAASGPLPVWSQFNQKESDLHHAQSFQTQTPFGVQKQRLPEQNLPLAGLLGQPIESNSGGMLFPDMMLASGLSQDQQSLNLLQQQQLLLQLNAQTPLSAQHQRLLAEKMLLLKHQQKQEEQQQLLRQQQQMFSQVLADQQRSQQRFGEPSYGQLQATFDALRLQSSKDMTQVPVSHEDQGATIADSLPVTHTTNQNVTSFEPPSLRLQHQLFGNVDPMMNEGTVLADQIDDTNKIESKLEYERTVSADYMNSLYSEKNVLPPDYRATQNVEEQVNCPDTKSSAPTITAPATCENELAEENDKDVYAGQGETSSELFVEIPATEAKTNELAGGQKTSKKKSRKQRAKQSADLAKTSSIVHLQEVNQPETGSADDSEIKGKTKKSADTLINNDTHLIKSSTATASNTSQMSSEADLVWGEDLSQQNTRTQVTQPGRAWKPAPGFKPKSLLEIQMEEQRVAQAEILAPKIITAVGSVGSAAPWSGIVTNADPNILRETHGESVQTGTVKPDDVLAKSSEKEREVMRTISNDDTYMQVTATNAYSLDEDDFIEAKETKRNRKKSAKAKNSGAKIASPVPTVDSSLQTNSVEKGKSSRVVQQQDKVLPAIPSGPSLGDFVLWKDETVNNPLPAAAWSTGPKKSTKPSSLRDILREQEKMIISSHPPPSPLPTTQKSTPPQPHQGGASWSRSESLKYKKEVNYSELPSLSSDNLGDAPPSMAVPQSSSQSRSTGDDEFFWGPVEQSTQESKQGDFPHLASQNSWGTKNTPGKVNAGTSLNRKKSVPSGSADQKEAVTKLTEANGFRDWCKSECLRLLGSEDTSVLEFCLKLSRSEAETLLTENLGSRDPDHKFIDKFLNYKDLLPSEVVEIAFQSKGSGVVGTQKNTREDQYYNTSTVTNDGFSKVGGKKKAKKGKKVNLSASVLGFNVVSNRIMMGEIQTIED